MWHYFRNNSNGNTTIRLAWTTDIHLNFLKMAAIEQWLCQVAVDKPDVLLITGDIGEATDLAKHLIHMVERLDIPIYFILGNHDYYRGSVESVRETVTKLHHQYDKLNWLPLCDVVKLNEKTALVGHGGWADGGYGDFLRSGVVLNDYIMIKDLAACKLHMPQVLQEIRRLGQEAGDYLRKVLPAAAETYQQVYVALHAPPFQEAAWHEGRTPTDQDIHLPHFTCKAAGDAVLYAAIQYPETQFTVLCGHTHGEGEVQLRPNLRVLTGGAEYGYPQIKQVFTVQSEAK